MAHLSLEHQVQMLQGKKIGTGFVTERRKEDLERTLGRSLGDDGKAIVVRPRRANTFLDPANIVVVKSFMAAAMSATTATLILNPFDVIKSRLQAQHAQQLFVHEKYYRNTLHCACRISAEEGVIKGLWMPGLAASIMRDVINGGIRIGLYPSVKRSLEYIWDPDMVGYRRDEAQKERRFKFAAGFVTGAWGSFIGNGFDIVKVRLQVESGKMGHLEDVIPDERLKANGKPHYGWNMSPLGEVVAEGEKIFEGKYAGDQGHLQGSRAGYSPQGIPLAGEHASRTPVPQHPRMRPETGLRSGTEVGGSQSHRLRYYSTGCGRSITGTALPFGVVSSGIVPSDIAGRTVANPVTNLIATAGRGFSSAEGGNVGAGQFGGSSSSASKPNADGKVENAVNKTKEATKAEDPVGTKVKLITKDGVKEGVAKSKYMTVEELAKEWDSTTWKPLNERGLTNEEMRAHVSWNFRRTAEEAKIVYTTGLYKGEHPKYFNTWEALQGLYHDGQMLRGVLPNVIRAALVTAGQISSYDTAKQYLIENHEMKQETKLFMMCGAISGFVSSAISAPVDLVKTRVMNDRFQMKMIGQKQEGFQFNGSFACFRRTMAVEGITVLWRGWFASWLRLGPHFMIGWPLLEFFRKEVFGLEYF